MEIRIKTGKLTPNRSILNTYARDGNYEYEQINDHGRTLNDYIDTHPENLIKWRRTANNEQPIQTENSKNVIAKWILNEEKPHIGGLRMGKT